MQWRLICLGLLVMWSQAQTNAFAQLQIPTEVRFLNVSDSFLESIGVDFRIESPMSGPLRGFSGTGMGVGLGVPLLVTPNVNFDLRGSFTNFAGKSGTQVNVPGGNNHEFSEVQFFRFGPQLGVNLPLGGGAIQLGANGGVFGGLANANSRIVGFDNSKMQLINPVQPKEQAFLFSMTAGGSLAIPTRFGRFRFNAGYAWDRTSAFTGANETSGGLTVGFAILSDIEAFFLLQAARGDARSNVMRARSVR